MPKRNRTKIEKPEDKIWREWFDKLSEKDHEQYLGKLGLTEEDMKELPEIEEELQKAPTEGAPENAEPEPAKKGKTKRAKSRGK